MLTKLRAIALTSVAAGLLIAGCGGGDGAGEPVTEDGPATLAPSDSIFYAEVTVRPDADRADAINSIASRFGAPGDVGDLIISELESSAAEEDFELDFEADIDPWLGERAGIFVPEVPAEALDSATGAADETDIEGGESDGDAELDATKDDEMPAAIGVEVTDTGAAQEFVDRVAEQTEDVEEGSYEGVDFFYDPEDDSRIGIFGDFLLIGNIPAWEAAVDAAGDDSLATNSVYTDAVAKLEDGAPASFFFNAEELISTLRDSDALRPDDEVALDIFDDAFEEPIVGSLDLTENSIFIDVVGAAVAGVSAGTTPLLEELPEDSFVALGVKDLGGGLGQVLDSFESTESEQTEDLGSQLDQLEAALGIDLREDVLNTIGDVAIFLSGDGIQDLQFGVVVETTDPAAAKNLVDQIGGFAALSGQGGPAPKGADSGFTVDSDGTSIAVGTRGDRLIIGVAMGGDGADAFAAVGAGKGPDLGEDLLGDGFEAAGFIDIQSIVPLVEASGETIEPEAEEILENLGRLVFGSKTDGDDVRSRTLLEIRGG